MQSLIKRPRLYKWLRPKMDRLLSYDTAIELADIIKLGSGRDAFALCAERFNPKIKIKGAHHIPPSGRCIIMANHPTGLADGPALFEVLNPIRPDHLYVANADALRVIPKGDDIIIPVEWVKEKRTHSKARHTVMRIKDALEHERSVIIFPSGAPAKLSWRGLKDMPWEHSAVMMARRHHTPIIPLHIKARNSAFFYILSRIHPELRNITLFHEMINKRTSTFHFTFGAPIAPESLVKNPKQATENIRNIVENLSG